MSKAPTLPFTKDEMGAELREILFIQASQIAHAGCAEAAWRFIGFEYGFSLVANPTPDDIDKVELNHFAAWNYLATAYDYAFQIGQCWGYSESDNHNIVAFEGGVTPSACYGDRSPFFEPTSKCRHVVDLAVGRWSLEAEDETRELAVRHLALLAGMSEPAVRNSLSAAKIPTPVERGVALRWLRDRKGFTPTRRDENQQSFWAAHTRNLLATGRFSEGMQSIFANLKLTPELVAKQARVRPEIVHKVLKGQQTCDNLDDLVKLGGALSLDVPYFVGQAIEAALRRDTPHQESGNRR